MGVSLDVDECREVAELYREIGNQEAVAAQLGMSTAAVSRRVVRAVEMGLLAPSRRGRPRNRQGLKHTVRVVARCDSFADACRELGISQRSLRDRLHLARAMRLYNETEALPQACDAEGRARRRAEMTPNQRAAWSELARLLGQATNLAAAQGQERPDWSLVVAEALGIVSGIKPGITDKTRRAG